ncbi:hypothetical protein MGA5115_00850 [Marinomonas gallaica]|uniref:Type VI secretion protein, VC_A0111 family n=2 Tax=Marinomonas gallaica TaxID=1806667 RepID=A0A1C3JNK2_9GAMM|nr:hypothetical protein MGA5115_00850 [Marinomonas gallaica]SBT20482.1 hypothetical protein MGA5116_01068 [Marinomonas gallaica]
MRLAATQWGSGTIMMNASVPYALPDIDFFQRLRLLEADARKSNELADAPIGYDYPLYREFVDFCVIQSLVSPYAAKQKIEMTPIEHGYQKRMLHVACFGLTGPSGVLPQHYTEMLAQRNRDKDTALKVLLDGFNARAISFLYRAWQKNRLAILEEQVGKNPQSTQIHPARKMMMSYTGLRHGESASEGVEHSPEEASTDDELNVPSCEDIAYYFSGYFSQRPRNANALRKIIGHVLGCDVSLKQFFGRWFELEPSQRNVLGEANCALGQSFVAGGAIYEGGFSMRLRTEPLDYSAFQRIRPGGVLFERLKEVLFSFLGADYWVDLQVVLKGHDRPALQIGEGSSSQPSLALGEGLWLSSEPADHDVADTVYNLNR